MASPRLERVPPLVLTGICRRHGRELDVYRIVRDIGRQWTDYMLARVAPPFDPSARRYGVTMRMADGDTSISYFCGAPPPEPPEVLEGFETVSIPSLTYAVFPFDGRILEFRDFVHAVFGREMASLGLVPAPEGPGVPEFVERYDWRFDPAAGTGGLDLMIPVAA